VIENSSIKATFRTTSWLLTSRQNLFRYIARVAKDFELDRYILHVSNKQGMYRHQQRTCKLHLEPVKIVPVGEMVYFFSPPELQHDFLVKERSLSMIVHEQVQGMLYFFLPTDLQGIGRSSTSAATALILKYPVPRQLVTGVKVGVQAVFIKL
jgi:hypothetical protein